MKNSRFIIRLSFWFAIMCGLFGLASTVAQAQIADCPSGLTNYWMFDELSGTSFTDAVGGKDAFCTDESDCPSSVSPGRISGALLFDGINDGLSVPADASFNWGIGDSFSIEFWMKTDPSNNCTGNQVFIGRNDPTRLQWWVGCEDGGTAAFWLSDTSRIWSGMSSTKKLNDGNWHHIVAVRDAGNNTVLFYLDGLKEGSASSAYQNGFDSPTSALNIGWLNLSPYYHFAGTIDEVALYKRVLSEKEILTHYYLVRGYCEMCSTPVRVMPIGDSITTGWNSQITDENYVAGYRQKLYLDLIAAGHEVDFVGSLKSGQSASPSFDVDHEGHDGFMAAGPYGWGEVLTDISGWLSANPPDVVLLHIGTNDVANNGQSAGEIAAILDKIDGYSKDIPVVLARIINTKPTIDAVTLFNDSVESMAGSRINLLHDKIMRVDMEHSLVYPDDMDDWLHPTLAGYDKMADVWFQTLRSFLPVCANSVPSTYTIDATAGTGGSITPSGVVTVSSGSNQTFTITPDTGYHLQSLIDNSVDVTGSVANGTYTISKITTDHTVVATFEINTYTVSATAGAGGSISPSGPVTVNHGSGQSFTITADSGYSIADVKVDGTSSGALSTYTFSGVTENHTIEVTFNGGPSIYTISSSANAGGSISPAGSVSVNSGSDQTFTITPGSGYRIADVKVDGVSVGAASTYTFFNVTANHAIKATFKRFPRIKAQVAGKGGSISPSGSVRVNYAASQTFTIIPDVGYRIADVKVDNKSVGQISTYTLSAVTANHKIKATFKRVP